jgi:NitT/TauT family transport system permease protein
MASPTASADALVSTFDRWGSELGATLVALALSFAISAVGGVLIGFAIGLSAFWSRVLLPLLTSAYAVPKVALYPVFLLIFGLTVQGRVAFSVVHGILPLIIICAEATRTVPAVYRKVARANGMSFVSQTRHILLPAILPSVVAGLRLAFGLCFLGLLVAEMFAAYEGMGFRLMKVMTLTQTDQIFAGVLLVALIALVGTVVFLLWQERQERRIGKVKATL